LTADPTTISTKVRLRFAKCGDLRLVSHHDLMRTLERTLRRANLPVARSQGFNPRPKVVFALALGLGIEGRREVVDLELTEPLIPVDVLTRLAAVAPPGLEFLEAQVAPPGRAPRPLTVWYALEIPEPRREAARAAAATFLADASRPHTRRRRDRAETQIDLRPFVLDAGLDPDGVLRFRLNVGQDGSARPEEVLETLNLRDLLDAGTVLARTEIELAPTP
jgi:radical SAM-linked protein